MSLDSCQMDFLAWLEHYPFYLSKKQFLLVKVRLYLPG
ncbi:hypothetical protein M622_19140 [Thauera terpenica 58Eu]|uniref:Uncharacterized protein n=1 Tax=Thauera terpenica 58Eu TaxID=1348657 RepID=T0AU28_9RHOO|nr:hypothetical protein M622_19140 [Thauera terpenica 58Eu]